MLSNRVRPVFQWFWWLSQRIFADAVVEIAREEVRERVASSSDEAVDCGGKLCHFVNNAPTMHFFQMLLSNQSSDFVSIQETVIIFLGETLFPVLNY